MRRVYLIIILPIVVFSTGHCQNYIFKVMANKGNNQFQLASQSTWHPIKLGSSLNKGDKLLVNQNAYLGLLHNSGHTMELSEMGTFDIEQLASKVGIRKKGISAKYAEFVLNDLEDKDHGQLKNAIQTRGLNVERIHIFLPFTAKIFNPSLVIHWSKLSGDVTYILSVNNMFGELLKQFETSSNQFQLDLGQDEFINQRLFIVNVSVKNDNSAVSNDIGIEKLSGEKAALIKQVDDLLKPFSKQMTKSMESNKAKWDKGVHNALNWGIHSIYKQSFSKANETLSELQQVFNEVTDLDSWKNQEKVKQ